MGPTKLSHLLARLSWVEDQLRVESQDSIEGRAGILRGGKATRSPFISVSSRRHVTSQTSPCYQIAQSPWGCSRKEGQDTKSSLENSTKDCDYQCGGSTQLLSLGEEMATSSLPESTLNDGLGLDRAECGGRPSPLSPLQDLGEGAKPYSKALTGLFRLAKASCVPLCTEATGQGSAISL